jgi:hypothetical protein
VTSFLTPPYALLVKVQEGRAVECPKAAGVDVRPPSAPVADHAGGPRHRPAARPDALAPNPSIRSVPYLFNPFMGEVFDQTVAKIVESLARRPRPLRVIYYYPIMHNALIDAGFTLDRHRRYALCAWATYRIHQSG